MLKIVPYYCCVVLLLCALAISDKPKKCETCTNMVKNFHKGLDNTSKSNFGGGNTHWEEKSLGSFVYSETRFVEITEKVCDDKKECHAMIEEYEEGLENWWFNEFAKGTKVDLHQYFCITHTKFCCPKGTFGKTCQECPAGKANPCNGHGDCKGDGDREGAGTCTCHAGYGGELCDTCLEGFYQEERNADALSLKCAACHESCKGGCTGEGPKRCAECKEGWEDSADEGCVDLDECDVEEDDTPCQDLQFCTNTPGSYTCESCNDACKTGCSGSGSDQCVECADNYFNDAGTCKACHRSCEGGCTSAKAAGCTGCKAGWLHDDTNGCVDVDECLNEPCSQNEYCANLPGKHRCSICHTACDGCTGAGTKSCKACAAGYQDNEGECQDINECLEEGTCPNPNESCENSPGRYSCVCKPGFIKKAGECVLKKGKKKKPKKPVKVDDDDDDDDDDDESPDVKVKNDIPPLPGHGEL